MFKNPFSFNGRICRVEYGLSYVIYMIAILIIVGILSISCGPFNTLTNFFMIIFWLSLCGFWHRLLNNVTPERIATCGKLSRFMGFGTNNLKI